MWIGGLHYSAKFEITLYQGATFIWGAQSNTYGLRAWLHGGRTLYVGPGCLFSEQILIWTSDHHSIIDLNKREQINLPDDVSIGKHVWVGFGARILKGATIGDGSIVGAGSVVTRAIPQNELWTGVPARLVRKNVSWIGAHPATPEDIQTLIDDLRS
jgi:acetyltransferase-like isoleucine patch superfamily enzyme